MAVEESGCAGFAVREGMGIFKFPCFAAAETRLFLTLKHPSVQLSSRASQQMSPPPNILEHFFHLYSHIPMQQAMLIIQFRAALSPDPEFVLIDNMTSYWSSSTTRYCTAE